MLLKICRLCSAVDVHPFYLLLFFSVLIIHLHTTIECVCIDFTEVTIDSLNLSTSSHTISCFLINQLSGSYGSGFFCRNHQPKIFFEIPNLMVLVKWNIYCTPYVVLHGMVYMCLYSCCPTCCTLS